MRCGKCQHEITPGTKFCNRCGWAVPEGAEGVAMTKKCPSCNGDMKMDALFCPSCGASAAAAPVYAETPVAPVAPVIRETVVMEKRPKSNLPVIILSIALVFALLLGGFALFMYFNKPTNQDAPQKQSEAVNENASAEEEQPEAPAEEPEAPAVVPEEEEEEPVYSLDEEKANSYLFPSDRRYITYGDLYGLTRSQVALIRNEIYARHGYVFQTEPYISYFRAKSWYSPNNPHFTESEFNNIERANKEFLVKYETEQGWR